MAVDFGSLCDRSIAYDGDLFRNIKTIRIAQDLFDDLSDDAADREAALQAVVAARVPSEAPLITRPFDYGSVIAYSFDPSHWQATRYGDARRFGVWYGSPETETTIYETVFHWHRFIMDSFAQENREITGERRLFAVRCVSLLIDLRGRERTYPALVDRQSYIFTQALGNFLFDQGQNGLLARSARCDGTIAALFKPDHLSRVRDRMFLTYRCNPTEDWVRVEKTAHKTWRRIRPSSLY